MAFMDFIDIANIAFDGCIPRNLAEDIINHDNDKIREDLKDHCVKVYEADEVEVIEVV